MALDRGQNSSDEPTTLDGRGRIISTPRSAILHNYETSDSENAFSSTSDGDLYVSNNYNSNTSENQGIYSNEKDIFASFV